MLKESGLAVTAVSDVTGFPEMLDGRVKTLHPKIHGGILARRDHPADLTALAGQGIGLIDVVVVNLYPFEETAKKAGVTFDELIENIDIGGPSMVRAAAKNFRDVLVVVDPQRYRDVLQALDAPAGPSPQFRFALAVEALARTAHYDARIAATLIGYAERDGRFERRQDGEPRPVLELAIEKVKDLRYGENPHQRGSLWESRTSPLGMRVVQGRELSYTNLLDVDAAWRIASEFAEPAAVVIKHTNPCGAATGASAAEAYIRARSADPLSAYGGIVGVNCPLDVAAAEAIVATFIEAVVAPDIAPNALPILARKDKMRVVLMPAEHSSDWQTQEFRSLLGGVLMQERDRVTEARSSWSDADLPDGLRVVTKRRPTAEEWKALRFAWRVCAHVKSNAVIFTSASTTLAIGAGQMSRVDAVNVAVAKALGSKVSLAGSVAASDAFFPFRDGLDAIANAGATAVVQPGGSVRDAEVIAAADEHGLAMVFTGRRHFRH
jgi:phosphoribosylaminoimidazolecarboxamide formyltransferase/IMP cyclohydrolase